MPESYILTQKNCEQPLPDACVDGTVWILKPGENANQGRQIAIYDTRLEIAKHVMEYFLIKNIESSLVIQRYILSPMLFNGRKFDIRVYGMMTSVAGVLRGYICSEGYIRTSSQLFIPDQYHDKYVHLTNDAI